MVLQNFNRIWGQEQLVRVYSGIVAGTAITTDFNVWQKGTSFSSVLAGIYTADRWLYLKSGSMVHDMSLSSDVPTVAQSGRLFSNSLKIVTSINACL